MKFSEMKYERPDLAAVKDELHALTERLKAARDYAEAREAFLAHEAAYIHMETQATLASVPSVSSRISPTVYAAGLRSKRYPPPFPLVPFTRSPFTSSFRSKRP